ncbi:MAG TPA: cytochrome c [Candidatus Sulfotelmatobacter sp.]|nr:cytochrome c [Candidatus Sulfotelmatobacter sp.]
MISKTMASTIVLLLALGAASQTENPAPKKDNSVYAELAKAPRKADARRNPLESDPDAVAAGGKLFDLHCAECHGEMADGGKKGPSLRADEVQQATPGTLFWLLTNGVVRRGMPVWSKLPEPQRWQLVSYIKSLSPAPRPDTESQPQAPKP